MFSALTERGAEATLDALALGATDYFAKPTSTGGLDESLAVIRGQLIPEIKVLCGRAKEDAGRKVVESGSRPLAMRPSDGPLQVLAVGASTGGPNALAEVFHRLPGDFPVPILIVQHMPPIFTRLLAERLSAQFPIRFHEAAAGGVLEPGHAYIAPG